MILQRKFALALTLALASVAANATPIVYTIGDGGQFGTVDLSTGAFTAVGPGISVGTGGLVQGPGNSLFSLGFNGNLNSINSSTGVLSTVGATGLGDCSFPTSPCGSNFANIVARLGSNLYATDFANNLYSVNSTTGAATLIGATGIPALPISPTPRCPAIPTGHSTSSMKACSTMPESSTPTSTPAASIQSPICGLRGAFFGQSQGRSGRPGTGSPKNQNLLLIRGPSRGPEAIRA